MAGAGLGARTSTPAATTRVGRAGSALDAVALAALAASLAAVNFTHGLSGDTDGHAVYHAGLFFTRFGYLPSRSWGFPAYELVAYPLIAFRGAGWARAYSLACFVGGVVALRSLLRALPADRPRAFLGATAYAVTPVAIISGNTVMETSQGLLLFLLGLDRCLRWTARRRPADLGAVAILLGLATATRPDYVIASGAAAVVVLMYARPSPRAAVVCALLWLACALAPFAIYAHVPQGVGPPFADSLAQRVARAGVGMVALFGVPATALLAWWTLARARARRISLAAIPADHVLALCALLSSLLLVRFVMLPDELEYVLLLVPLVMVALVRAGLPATGLLALAVALAIPNGIQLHLLVRDRDGAVRWQPGLSPGAIAQDRSARLRNVYIDANVYALMSQVAARNGRTGYQFNPSTEPGALVIIPEDRLRFYDPARHGGRYHAAACSQTIVVYPMPSHRGWRQLTRFDDWRPLRLEDFRRVSLPECGESVGAATGQSPSSVDIRVTASTNSSISS